MTLDDSFLKKNIAMLDNNTISVDHLTNKLCIILNKMGYERTTALENSISEILTKYKKKEITGDEFVSLFNGVTSNNTDTGNNTGSNNNETGNSADENNNTGNNNTGNNNNNDENSNNDGENNNTENNNTGNNNNNTGSSNNGSNTGSSNNQNTETPSSSGGDVVDIDTDISSDASSNIDNVEATIESATLTIPGAVAQFVGSIEADAEQAKQDINEELNNLKESIVEAVEAVTDIDDEIPQIDVNTSLTDLVDVAYDVNQNRAALKATVEFFRNGGCTIEGNCAILTVDGKECKYDMKSNKFYVNGQYAFDASFYVPSGVTDYSQCNTYTFFCSSSNDYKDVINNRSTNSVVLKITKYSEKVHFDKYDEVATATKFTNQVANTDLNNCQNVIAGDSIYGAHSLKIAARSGDLYQTVYCVDNAALVTDINAHRNSKEQFSTIEDLKGLDGKNVIFMSASGDDNLACRFGNSAMTKCNYDQAYTYTGVRLVCETCPNAKVSFIYQPTKSYQNKIASLYKNLENEYSNFSYDTTAWDSYARKRYEYHSGGNYIVSDLAEAPATNINRYNAAG